MTECPLHGPHFERLSPADRIDVLCDAWEREWTIGRRPRLEDYFDESTVPNPPKLLRELLGLEIEYRRRRGETIRPSEYLQRFPRYEDAVREAIVEETAGSSGSGPPPFLSRVAPFIELPGSVNRLIESHMHEEALAPGARLIRQGRPGTSLLVLKQGEVDISTNDERAGRRFISRARSPQVLGEMALLTEEPRTADVTAVTPVQTLVLPAETFHWLTKQYPEISIVLTLLVASRLGVSGREDVLTGKMLDRYRINRRLGRGGMSVVYEADELQTGNRVALKMMSHRLVYDDAALAQFQREADLIESFQHENIVRMYGRFAAFHTYFIVMQFCDGQTLDEVLRARGGLSEIEVQRILGQIAHALTYAHAADVIHRDIKPSNVMLNRDGTVKLMDFGLAKPLIDTHSKLLNLIAGTPQYMAPEQLAGESVGKEADLFALGCLTYEMLTGRPLFPQTDVALLMQRHVEWETPDPCGFSFDPALARFLNAALQKDPHKRRVNLEELASWAAPVDASLLSDTDD